MATNKAEVDPYVAAPLTAPAPLRPGLTPEAELAELILRTDAFRAALGYPTPRFVAMLDSQPTRRQRRRRARRRRPARVLTLVPRSTPKE